MKEEINKLLNDLLSLENKGFSDAKYINGEFSFMYGGGKFILIRSVSANFTIGYLNLFHETPFEGKGKLIEIDGFEIIITKNNRRFAYKITNHIEFTPDDYQRIVDEEGYMRIESDDLLHIFPNQVIAKLVKDNFKIYLK